MALVHVLAWSAVFVVVAGVVLGWLDLLRPRPRRWVMWSRPWIITLVTFTGSTLLFFGWLLTRPAGMAHTITLAVSFALLAPMAGAGVFILRPASRDFKRALRLSRQGDAGAARMACQQVIDMPGARPAPKASLKLGILLAEQGDAEGARAAHQWAIDRGPRDVRKLARLALQEPDSTHHSG